MSNCYNCESGSLAVVKGAVVSRERLFLSVLCVYETPSLRRTFPPKTKTHMHVSLKRYNLRKSVIGAGLGGTELNILIEVCPSLFGSEGGLHKTL